jgi:hypothetical protein
LTICFENDKKCKKCNKEKENNNKWDGKRGIFWQKPLK